MKLLFVYIVSELFITILNINTVWNAWIIEVEVHMTKIEDNNRFVACLTSHLFNSIYKRKGTIDPMDNYNFRQSFG